MAKTQRRTGAKRPVLWKIFRDGKTVEVPLEEALDWAREHSPATVPHLLELIAAAQEKPADQPTT